MTFQQLALVLGSPNRSEMGRSQARWDKGDLVLWETV